ncbi:MAG: histidine kinase [Verrucomicrobiales bacterium]|nr:histidine kinase [Verrucomicrobiales bacterium]
MRLKSIVPSLYYSLLLIAVFFCCLVSSPNSQAQDQVASWRLFDSKTRELAESIQSDQLKLEQLIEPAQIPITGSSHGFQTPPSNTAKARPPVRIQWDFSEAVTIDAIAIYPAIRPSLSGPRSLGMPTEFRISFNQQTDQVRTTFSLSPDLPSESTATPAYVTHENIAPDSPLPVWIEFAPRTISSLTLLIPELALISNNSQDGQSQYACLFAEIEVYQGQKNVAPEAKLSSPNSLKNKNWGLRFLCDGNTPLQTDTDNTKPSAAVDPTTQHGRSWAEQLSQRRILSFRIQQQERLLAKRLRRQNSILSISAAILIAVLLFATISNWLLARRRQVRAVMTDRERIANDLHDEVGGALGSISLLTQKLISTSDAPQQKMLLEKVYAAAAEARAGVREAVWASSSSAVDNKTFENHLRAITDRMLPDCETQWQSNGSAITPTLTARKQHHFGMFFREAIHNIQKHAKASEVSLRFQWNPRNMTFTLSDNGEGLNDLPASSENFRTLRYRAEQLPAKLEIQSNPGGGTRFTLTTPLI